MSAPRLPPGLPVPSGHNLAVRITKDAARQVRAGHPWLFDASITSLRSPAAATTAPAAGDLAVVFGDDRRFLAVGLYDPASPIRVRVLHHGAPLAVDRAFWAARLAEAWDRRGDLTRSPETTAWRWVHGENDRMPGLVIDRYGSTSVIKLYTSAWIPHLAGVLDVMAERLGPDTVVLRLGRNVAAGPTFGLSDGATIQGPVPPGPVPFREHGLHFVADVVHGQKTGHFLDQRDNRARVGERAAGRSVLDVFCCTGGFSVHAAAGGAQEVHGVDLSRHAVEAAGANMARNRDRPPVRDCRYRSTVGDAFEVMARLAAAGERYGMVVVDPPSFASRQSDVGAGLRAYGRLTDLALALLRPGGTLVQASCSARISAEAFFAQIHGRAGRAGVRLADEVRTGHAVDHPVGFAQGAYLKALFATVA